MEDTVSKQLGILKEKELRDIFKSTSDANTVKSRRLLRVVHLVKIRKTRTALTKRQTEQEMGG
jgi:hypothetical protein